MAYLYTGNWVLSLDLKPPERGEGCGKSQFLRFCLPNALATLNFRSNGGGADVGNGDIGKERPAASSRPDTLVL
jgi:hypothetical protein